MTNLQQNSPSAELPKSEKILEKMACTIRNFPDQFLLYSQTDFPISQSKNFVRAFFAICLDSSLTPLDSSPSPKPPPGAGGLIAICIKKF
jgi:hypothetical protein